MLTLLDFIERADFLFKDELVIADELKSEHFRPQTAPVFCALAQRLEALTDFNAFTAETAFRELVAAQGLSASDLVHPVRVALTGRTIGPGLFETMSVLGKERTISRLRQISS
jgi:glutamyl-tRNA synthetase